MAKEKTPPEEIKPNDPLETLDESEETPDFAKIKGRIKSEDATEFDKSTVGDAVPSATEEEKKEETPEEPPKETPEEPAKEPEAGEPAAPEVPTEAVPAPTALPSIEGLPEPLSIEEKSFDATLKNPEWRPETWLELHEEQERYKAFIGAVDEYRNQQEFSLINKSWDDQLVILKTKGNVYGVELPADPDRKVEKQIFAIMTEFGDEQKGTVMPLPKAAKIWQERQQRTKPTLPGGNAPISTGETEAPKVTGKKYSDIHGKSVDDLIELGLKGQES